MQAQLITVRREQQALVSSVANSGSVPQLAVSVNSDAVPQLAVSASPPAVVAVKNDAVPQLAVSASPSAVATVNSDAVPHALLYVTQCNAELHLLNWTTINVRDL